LFNFTVELGIPFLQPTNIPQQLKMADIQSAIREIPPVTRFMLVSTAVVTL
jgi:hypothetical protein